MSTEKEKAQRGELYDANYDAELLAERDICKDMCYEYNQLRPSRKAERQQLIRKLFGKTGQNFLIEQPFYCDYGKHIRVGKRFFANFGLTVLDEAYVTIGDDCFIGPNVGIYTACHDVDPGKRNSRDEWARPVNIGDNCWIGGGATILPGVSIGSGCTIGAGSVVVHDIPDNSVAVGNPAKVVKKL